MWAFYLVGVRDLFPFCFPHGAHTRLGPVMSWHCIMAHAIQQPPCVWTARGLGRVPSNRRAPTAQGILWPETHAPL